MPISDLRGVTAWAVIPARGGSKGIPRKNLATIGGISLLSRSIRACLACTAIDQTIVSTDDPEMGELSQAEGAVVIWRPEDLSSDAASSESVVLHAIETLAATGAEVPRFSLLIQCTSPFTSASDLDDIIGLLLTGTVDSCFTATRSHSFLWRKGGAGTAVAVNHNPSIRLPRQALSPEYLETGAAYGFATEGFLRFKGRFFGRIGMVEVDSERSIEIDEPLDLDLARALASIRQSTVNSTNRSDKDL